MPEPAGDAPTTLVLLRHGVTESTVARVFSGRGGEDPGLTDLGRAQAGRAAARIERDGGADVVVTSPLRRARETAELVAVRLRVEVLVDDDLAETGFGAWDGLGFGEVRRRWPQEVDAWLGDSAVAPPGGESLDDVDARVGRARDRMVDAHRGRRVVVTSHVTPIKLLARSTLEAPVAVVHRLELAPGSLSTVRVWPDGVATLQAWSVLPEAAADSPTPVRPR